MKLGVAIIRFWVILLTAVFTISSGTHKIPPNEIANSITAIAIVIKNNSLIFPTPKTI